MRVEIVIVFLHREGVSIEKIAHLLASKYQRVRVLALERHCECF